jgi:hypothetical protein
MRILIRNISAAALMLAASLAFGQKNKPAPVELPIMPVNEETKLIAFSGVIDENANKTELYKRAMNFFKNNYKNPAEVIKTQDEAGGEIEGVGRYKIFNPEDKTGVKTDAGLVSYTINIKLKDNKYKYEITKINWKQSSYFPVEKWMDKNSPSYQANYDQYLIQTNEQIRDLEEKLKAAMKIPSEKQKSSDW